MKNKSLPDNCLFRGFTEEETESVLKCLSAVSRSYKKDEYIFRMGDTITTVGMVITGSVQVMREDYWGDRQIIAGIGEGQIFGESYACAVGEPLMVSVMAAENTEVMFLEVRKLLTVCPMACQFHSRVIQNLLTVIAGRNLTLTTKIDHMSKKTIREKVLSYLSFQAEKEGKGSFDIPFNRQQLADYLAVDRSALSAELSKMQKEQIISYDKNHFVLL